MRIEVSLHERNLILLALEELGDSYAKKAAKQEDKGNPISAGYNRRHANEVADLRQRVEEAMKA